MIKFIALLEKFGKKGDKTGWIYFTIPSKLSAKINPNVKKAYRVKGKLDAFPIKSIAILPMGDGSFIMPVNASMRKGIKKRNGEKISVSIEIDLDNLKISSDLLLCLKDDEKARSFFDNLSKSHQNYYSKWIESAKTEATKTKRIALALNGFRLGMGYVEMLRHSKTQKIE